MRVLDTAALLYWPVTELSGGICSTSQQSELEQVSLQRYMLISSLDIDWRVPTPDWIDEAKQQAASSGDLPRLSAVDVDVLALAIGLNMPLYTDDYRMQNVMQMAGLTTHSVSTTGAKQVWQWELRCTGCRATEAVPPSINSSKSGPVKECSSCGAAMMLKRKKQ